MRILNLNGIVPDSGKSIKLFREFLTLDLMKTSFNLKRKFGKP